MLRPRLILSDEQVATLRTLWPTGLRRDEIARAANLTVDSLLAAKALLGLPNLRRGARGPRTPETNPTPDEIAAVCAEIRQGWSIAEHAIRQGYRPLESVDTEAARKHRIVPIRAIVAAWDR
jgi:hypothetical protein